MIFDNLILNNINWDKLNNSFKNKKVPNAYIFFGKEGIGKEAHAIEFFGLLNCKKNDNNKACGLCSSCQKTKILQHEFLQIITPLPRSKSIKNGSPLDVLTDKQRIELF